MKRRLFTILSALSLLLFVAVVVLWVVSYWWMPSVGWGGGRETGFGWTLFDHELGLSDGSVYYCRFHGPMVSVPPMAMASSERSEWFGVVHARGYWGLVPDSDVTVYRTYIAAPLWPVAAAAVLLFVIWLARWWKRFRCQHSGLCPSCGYDLRATPGRCPECGLVPAAPPPPPTSRGNVQ